MKRIDFRMERPDLLKVGDHITVSEYVLKTLQGTMYYYTINPAIAMSGNIPKADKLNTLEGIVDEIQDEGALWTVWCCFED